MSQKIDQKTGIVYLYSSDNNTIIHITDITGAETICRCSAGMVTDKSRLKGTQYPAMKVAKIVAKTAIERGIKNVYLKIRAPGGIKSKIPGKGAQPAIRTLIQEGMKIIKIEDNTPIDYDSNRKKGGRRGRRV
ncbi:MAG: 30S ribosomal protein S11 [Candidatus Aenigmarchaeota archaeon ex4484_52]|nr:MAG: 30S ribosomal protein S11 [Candidatus Aenigmarchaeota archaeon ex4484_52]